MGQLDGKVALVTGSAHSIGKSIAIGLARQGASLVLADKDGLFSLLHCRNILVGQHQTSPLAS